MNKVAVETRYVSPRDPNAPGRRLTAEGREFLATSDVTLQRVSSDSDGLHMHGSAAEAKRMELIEACKAIAWQAAIASGDAIENVVGVLADEADAKGSALLRALGLPVEPGNVDMNASLAVLPSAPSTRSPEP